MSNKILHALVVIACLSSLLFAAEITLQNGLNNYKGCSDTHVRTYGMEPPHDFWYDNFANDSLNIAAN